MTKTITLVDAASAFLEERYRHGFVPVSADNHVPSFARYAADRGHIWPMTEELCLRWAREDAATSDPFNWARRLDSLRPFSRFLSAIDLATRFPSGSPFGCTSRRLVPHIYTDSEILRIVSEAGTLPPVTSLRPALYSALFGLLASTGLRISEALALCLADTDLDRGHLTIRASKAGSSRLVPLHPTAVVALEGFLSKRGQVAAGGREAHLFSSCADGRAVPYTTALYAFSRLPVVNDTRPRGGYARVRIHDLRHTFVCRRLMLWLEQGVDIDNAVLALSTYVGHAQPLSTYWYMEAIPELMALTSARFERAASTLEGKTYV